MGFEGKSFRLEPFSMENTVIETKFDASEITNHFQETLNNQLEKQGLTAHKGQGEPHIIIRGQVINVDEGNRWLRYLLAPFAGKTVFEVEGEVVVNGVPAGTVQSIKKSRVGLLGGNSKSLLKGNARAAAADIAHQVIKVLKRNLT